MHIIRCFFSTPPIDTVQLRLNAVGVQEWMPPCVVNRPDGTPDYLFMFFYDEVVIHANGEARQFPGVHMIIWEPNRWHYYGNTEQRWNHSWTHCAGQLIRECLSRYPLPLNEPFPLPGPAMVEKYLIDIYHEVNQHPMPNARLVGNIYENWIIEMHRYHQGEHGQAMPACIAESKQYLEEHYTEAISLEALAQRAHLSIPHFCHLFKTHVGTPANQYQQRLRMHRAAYLLRDHNQTITDIARQVGYQDIYQFSKAFKKHYGVSPRGMRRGG